MKIVKNIFLKISLDSGTLLCDMCCTYDSSSSSPSAVIQNKYEFGVVCLYMNMMLIPSYDTNGLIVLAFE